MILLVERAMRIVAMSLVALLVACGAKSEADSLKAAKDHLSKGKVQSAVLEIKSVLQRSPSNAEARFLLGIALLNESDFAAAQTELSKAQEAGYDEQLVAPKLARAKVMSGQAKQVIEAYSGMLLQDPKAHAEMRTAVAVAYATLGQAAKGEQELEAALKVDPGNAWALLTKARFAAAKGDFDGGLALIDKVISGGNRTGEAYLQRAAILRFGKQDIDGAIAAYTKAVDDPTVGFQARLSLLNAYLLKGNAAAAKEQMQGLKKSFGTRPQTRLAEAQIAYLERDYDKAKEVIDGLLRNAPESKLLLAAGGAIDMRRGALLAAETKLTRAIQTSEPMPFARKILAETYIKMGQSDRAIATLRPLLESAIADRDALVMAGQAQLMAGHLAEAESYFDGARKLAPNDSSIRTALALTELAKGNAEAAFATLQAVARQDQGQTADLALISAHLRRREYDLALKAVDELERKQPNAPVPYFLRGIALRGKGDAGAARAALELALQRDAGFFDATAQLVALDIEGRKFDAAQTRLEAAIKNNPRNGVARARMIDVLLLRRAKPAQVDSAILDAIKANPLEAAIRLVQINRLLEGGKVNEALAAAQDAQLRLPDSGAVLEALGRAQQAAGERQQAISSFQKLASLEPRSPRPHLAIAGIHAASGDRASAERSINRAYEVAPLSADVHRFLLSTADQAKDVKTLLGVAKDLQQRHPNLAVGYALEGEAEAIRKNWVAAARIHGIALTKPDATMSHRLRQYDMLAAGKRLEDAEQVIAQWQLSHPKDSEFLSRLGEIALARKDYVTAERRFKAVIAVRPNDASAFNNMAWIAVQRGGNGAVALAEKALSLSPNNAIVLDTLAAARAAEGNLDEAVKVQQQAIAAAADPAPMRFNLVMLLAKAGQMSKAKAELAALESDSGPLPSSSALTKLKQSLDAR